MTFVTVSPYRGGFHNRVISAELLVAYKPPRYSRRRPTLKPAPLSLCLVVHLEAVE